MAKPGPKPKPRLEAINGQDGQGLPACPEWLDATARECWEYHVKELGDMGLLARLDRDMLAAYCQEQSKYIKACRIINQLGVLIAGRTKKEAVKNPAHQVARDALLAMTRIAAEFGMTPSSRSSLAPELLRQRRMQLRNEQLRIQSQQARRRRPK